MAPYALRVLVSSLVHCLRCTTDLGASKVPCVCESVCVSVCVCLCMCICIADLGASELPSAEVCVCTHLDLQAGVVNVCVQKKKDNIKKTKKKNSQA